jgi:phosphoribosyl-AMP cyclohydrolase
MIAENVNQRISASELTSVVKYSSEGLVPAIIQDRASGSVLMMAWMNKETLAKTIETGRTWFWSRSRKELWAKGETSGDIQIVLDIAVDCDGDTLLIEVDQKGKGACHTGNFSCFYRGIAEMFESST